jgi:hypothetical protein
MMLRTLTALALAAAAAGCSTTQVHRNSPTAYAPTAAGSVQVLYSEPKRPYESVGIVSANRYKPGWTDPSVADAIPQLQAAGASLGADVVIVRASRSQNTRNTLVEAEAIRYTDRHETAPSGTPSPTSDCAACKKIGGG